MSVQARIQRVPDAVKCRRCGLSLIEIRAHPRDTIELTQRQMPADHAEVMVAEMRRIWTGGAQ